MLGRENLALLVNLSQIMAAKMYEPILHVRGWINGQNAITVARMYSRMIRGSQPPSTLQDREPYWDLSLGLGLEH